MNEGGYMIAQDVPYSESHRHYSHLLMIYPFTKSIGIRQKIIISLKNPLIHGKSKPEALQGYSLTGHASMKAMMGHGNESRIL